MRTIDNNIAHPHTTCTVNVGLAQARPNYPLMHVSPSMARQYTLCRGGLAVSMCYMRACVFHV